MRCCTVPLLALLVVPLALGAVIVVGDCAEGDYHFDDVYDALKRATKHKEVNIIICNVRELERDVALRADRVWISGGKITSEDARLTITGNRVAVTDLNLSNVFLNVSAKEVLLRNVSSALRGKDRCIEVNSTVAVIDNVKTSGCDEGVRVRGKTLKEKVYRIPPEMVRELRSCEQRVAILLKKKGELERELRDLMLEEDRKTVQKTYPDVWVLLGTLVAGFGAGYLLGRM